MPGRHWIRSYAAATLALAMSTSPTTAVAQPKPWLPVPRYELRATQDSLVAELVRATATRKPDEPGVAVALLRDGQPPVTRYIGIESVIRGTPIGPETRFYIASLAKTMTATAALLLRDRGKLPLQAPVSQWIEGLPACARNIRVIHLLQHTSGLPDYHAAFGDTAIGVDNARVMAFVRGLDSLEFEPGVRFAYSNTGYVLLAEVIGRASGLGFATFLADSVFRPLGMKSTWLIGGVGSPSRRVALGYSKKDGIYQDDDLRAQRTQGPGGVYSTLGDVMAWYRATVESKLLKPATTALLFETPVTLSGRKSYLGMGWSDETPGPRTPKSEGLRAFGSFGELGGHRAAMLFYPDHGLAWIALSNAGEGAFPPEGMLERLFRRLP